MRRERDRVSERELDEEAKVGLRAYNASWGWARRHVEADADLDDRRRSPARMPRSYFRPK